MQNTFNFKTDNRLIKCSCRCNMFDIL